MDKNYLTKLFIDEAKPALNRHSGSGGGAFSIAKVPVTLTENGVHDMSTIRRVKIGEFFSIRDKIDIDGLKNALVNAGCVGSDYYDIDGVFMFGDYGVHDDQYREQEIYFVSPDPDNVGYTLQFYYYYNTPEGDEFSYLYVYLYGELLDFLGAEDGEGWYEEFEDEEGNITYSSTKTTPPHKIVPTEGLFDSITNTVASILSDFVIDGEILADFAAASPITVSVEDLMKMFIWQYGSTAGLFMYRDMSDVSYYLSNIDTSNVTRMDHMFEGCYYLTSVPEFDTSSVTNMSGMFSGCTSLTSVPEFDTSSATRMDDMFSSCTRLTSVPKFDTSNVTDMEYMFSVCTSLTSVPEFDTSSATRMDHMFSICKSLTSVPKFDTSNVTDMEYMFEGCYYLTSVPEFDTSSATRMDYMFYNCSRLTSVHGLDLRNVDNTSMMFSGCKQLTDCRLKNIKSSLQVGSGTSYGHLLTVDSLVSLIYELRKQSSSKTLTVGSANLEKLANVYVKLVDITYEMRAEDDLIDEKYPFVVCESTDEGAMLIKTYAENYKSWTIK